MELLFSTDASLNNMQICQVIEAGLTYVLYQRGQIPLPYQQLEKSAKVVELEDKRGRRGENWSCDGPVIGVGGDNPRERISLLLHERRQRLAAQRLEKCKRKAMALEAKAYNSIKGALDILQHLVGASRITAPSNTCPNRIMSVALVLGASIYCPKEIYCFDLPPSQEDFESTEVSTLLPEQFQNTVLRKFYKSIITNSDLMDFTGKPLAKTYSHLCVISTGDLECVRSDMDNIFTNVTQLPTIPPTLCQALASAQTGGGDDLSYSDFQSPIIDTPFARKAKNKCFRVKIHDNSIIPRQVSAEANSTNDSFSSEILFDSNSFSCYQIPLRFKGVTCKTKM